MSDRWALQRAKYMTEYEYAVVGILEGWNATLAVLEHYLPAFFQGASQRYWSKGEQQMKYLVHSAETFSQLHVCGIRRWGC